jgi:Domain of unknown function (DUF3854)
MSIEQTEFLHTHPERKLSQQHRHTLEVGSAIAPDVIGARGVYSVERGRDLPTVFSRRQRGRGPGMLFTGQAPNGETFPVYRPRAVDPDNPGHKYEMPPISRGGAGNRLDVHPFCQEWIEDSTVPVVFVEGIKKADSILSAARKVRERVVVVAISGVWNFLSGGEPIPDMFAIPLRGREVRVCFDNDVFCNPDVADAARRLAEHIRERRATSVKLAYLPQAGDGAKVGADDYLAAGRTYADLEGCFKPFDAVDLAAERLRRSDLLRARLEDTWHTFWVTEWRGMGGGSARDLYKVLRDLAGDRGRLHPEGLRVKASRRELVELVRVSSRTIQRSILLLEGMGLAYRDNVGRKAESRGAFVLRAKVNHGGQGKDTKEKESKSLRRMHAGGLPLRSPITAPRLRWSTPGRKARRGTVPGTRRVRDTVTPAREAVKRLGKIRGAVVDALVSVGGSATIAQLCEILRRKRPRDLRRRVMPMLVEAGIVALDGEVATLTPDRVDRLAEIDDLEADRLRRRIWHDKDRDDFREYRERQHSADRRYRVSESKPTAAGLASIKRSREKRAEYLTAHGGPGPECSPAPIPDLARTVADYLERNPGAVREHRERILPGWLAGTLWAYDLYPVKVEAADVREAIEELGGSRYLTDRIRAGTPRREDAA